MLGRPRSPGRFAATLLTLTLLAPSPGASQERTDASLQALVQTRLDALDAQSSVWAKHLPSGRTIQVRGDVPMNPLSVIKVAVMVRAYRDHEAGRLDLDERHRILPGELRRGSGLLQTFEPGLEPTVRDLVTQMIVTSDNTATDLVIAKVGLERVNALMDTLGLPGTRLRMSTGDLFRELWVRADPAHAALTARQVFERGFPSDPGAAARSFALEGDSTRWLGRTTAAETGRLLERLHRGELASEASTREMLAVLGRQLYSSRLPRFLAGRASVAHKTGDWPPHAGNDVGILTWDGGPVVVAAFVNQNRGPFLEVERTLGRIAEDLVGAWR